MLLGFLIACRSTTYTAHGEVIEIDLAGTHVTIDHDDVPGLMPAMRMRFPVRDPALLRGVSPGSEVRFALERAGETLMLTALEVVGGAPRPRPGIHDHRPHHGGVVSMIGLRHLEAVAARDGRIRVYVSDAWRRPLPLDGWEGRATVDLEDGAHAVELAPTADALAGNGPALTGRDVLVHLRLAREGEPQPLEAHLTVPLEAGTSGAAVAPRVRCEVAARDRELPAPRCTLDFSQPISTLVAIPGGTHVALGIVNAGVSVWDATTGAFVRALDAPPAVEANASGEPHPEIVDALAVAPDGAEAMVASEGRLLRYAVASGRLLRIFPAPEPILRGILWHPDGRSIVAYGAYGALAWRLAAADGTKEQDLHGVARVTALAVARDGRIVIGDETGQVRAFDAATGASGRSVARVERPVRGLALIGDRLVVATGAGAIEIVDAERGVRLGRSVPGSPCYRIAASERTGLLACATFDRRIRLHALASGGVVGVLDGHSALVQGLAWSEAALVSGDGEGHVVIWDDMPR